MTYLEALSALPDDMLMSDGGADMTVEQRHDAEADAIQEDGTGTTGEYVLGSVIPHGTELTTVERLNDQGYRQSPPVLVEVVESVSDAEIEQEIILDRIARAERRKSETALDRLLRS